MLATGAMTTDVSGHACESEKMRWVSWRTAIVSTMEENVIKIILAVAVGLLIGAERELRVGQGLRTIALVCLGATLFTIYSDHVDFFGQGDPRRIAAAVVTGVGFLGAGMVLRHERGVAGLTTAAAVWLVAALGMGIAMGLYWEVAAATVAVLFVLWAIPLLQQLGDAPSTQTYVAVCALGEETYDGLIGRIREQGLNITKQSVSKDGEQMVCEWRLQGSHARHEQLSRMLLKDPDVREFRSS